MAAFGVLAALRSGEGQFVDIAMADGALSLLAMPFAGMLAGGAVPRRGAIVLGGRLLCYRVYACADGYVSVGALEPKAAGRARLVPGASSQHDRYMTSL